MAVIIFSFLFFILNFSAVNAAEVYFSSRAEETRVGDVFVVEAKISSPELINVADGSILFDKEKLEVRELSTGGSIFSLWASGPSFSNADGRINFVGGTPGGFQGDGSILRAIFIAKKTGEAGLVFDDGFSLNLSDGKGTEINPAREPFTVSVSERSEQVFPKDEWQALVQEDKTPPEFIEAIISRDPRVFDNNYFISFFAVDNESGITYYEIREGGGEFYRAESPYLIKDQTPGVQIQIKAVDKAGNEKIIVLSLSEEAPFYITSKFWAILILILIAVGLFFGLKLKRKK